jgi:hypothetical protein
MPKLLSRELASGPGVKPERPSEHFKFTGKTPSGSPAFHAQRFRIDQLLRMRQLWFIY